VIKPADSKPAHFDQSCESRRRPHEEASVPRFKVNAIITHQQAEPQQPCLRRSNEREREARLAGSRRSADQHCASTR
jgi:hypothetical protein